MKEYSPFELASLIIHEQTHATFFATGGPELNEALATFVGVEGALEWLRSKYGERSTEYQSSIAENADSQLFGELLRGLARELDAVYQEPVSREEKLARKAEIIGAFKGRLAGEVGARFRTKPHRKVGPLTINNALLLLYRLYSDDAPLLRSSWERRCGRELRRGCGIAAHRYHVRERGLTNLITFFIGGLVSLYMAVLLWYRGETDSSGGVISTRVLPRNRQVWTWSSGPGSRTLGTVHVSVVSAIGN